MQPKITRLKLESKILDGGHSFNCRVGDASTPRSTVGHAKFISQVEHFRGLGGVI